MNEIFISRLSEGSIKHLGTEGVGWYGATLSCSDFCIALHWVDWVAREKPGTVANR